MNWLQKLLGLNKKKLRKKAPSRRGRPPTSSESAKVYIDEIQKKMYRLSSDFADGLINRTQFQAIYSHYQKEISQVESILATEPDSWEKVSTQGESIMLRKRYLARAQAYAIYDNATGMPLGILGTFRLDPTLVIPMLSSYRSATNEIFGSSLRLTQHEDGQWLCFVSGRYTTMMAVFTNEPIPKQLQYLYGLHQHFERANEPYLMQHPIKISELIYPHEYFLGKWQR